MFKTTTAALALSLACAGALAAETFEVQMLNKGEEGNMVFEPSALRIAPGDSVKFIAAKKGHNAETIKEMIPEGADMFVGKINEEIEVTLTEPGFYGIKCKPHYAMGMVMVIAVGDDAAAPEGFLEGRIPKTAMARFEDQLGAL